MADLTDDQKRLKDFTKKKLQEQGIISSPAEPNNQITPQDNGGFFLPWISNTIPQVNSYEWWIKQGNIQTNIPLPWITNKPETISAIDPHEAIEWMERFRKEESNRVTSQYWTLVKRWFKQIWNTFDKFANANLSKEWILEKLARIGEVNWASKKAMQPYIEENKSQTLAYNKKVNDAFAEWEKRNMDMNILKKYEEETVSWLLSRWDFKWAWYKLIKWLSENATMIPEMVVTMVAPQVWLPLIATDVYIQESQWTFEDLIENWATYEQAENWAVIVWLANASIELILERLLWWVQRAWASTLRRLFLKNMQKEVVRNVTKKWFAEILGKWLLNQVKSSWVEWIEEILQQLVSNAFINTVNPAKKLSEGVIESFDQAFWQSFFFPLWWWSESVIKDIQTNNAIDKVTDIEALKYVMDREEAKAQRNRFNEAKERLKNRIINWYTNTQEESEQIAKENEAREQFEQERDEEYKKEMQIENDMINEALLEWDLNEDLWDPRYQKSDSPQSVSEDTVREKSRTWNVSISSENSSEISKNLNEIKKNLEDLKADTFLQQIKKSISWDEKNSNYITNRINGNKYVLRIADHHANAKNSKKSPYNNTSIVVKLVKRKNNGKNIQFKKYKSVDMIEFVYNPENMTTEKMQGIIDWIQNWIKTWEYTDTNYDSKNQSTRKIWEKSDAKYQWGLKYEEDDYIPWIASNKEKSISGKEWIKQRNKINDQTIEELAKKYWVRIDVIKWMIKYLENGKRDGKSFAYGKYVNDLLTLSEQIKESTAPHELLHAIFDMIDPETKAYLISQVMKTEWWSAGRAEERLADSFSNFFRTGKIEWAPKSTWWKIKIFFKRVRSFINWLGKWRNELEDIFTNIITADDIVDLQNRVDENKSLNKSKEAMRKRFMEYRKNAIKIQKKAESKNKYQKAWDTESEAFKKRFGDSKVVDENWNPLVVYHGTPYGWFTVFKKTNRWSIWDEWYFGRGWYFTNDKALAKDYSDEAFIDPEERTNEPWAYGNVEIKEVYLKIENPYVVNEKDVEYEMWSLEKLLGTKNPSESTEKLKDEWYDGVIYEFNSGTKEYTVFEPNQIKSATDNIGTYDANNDDIRYQRGYHGSQVEFKKFDHSHMWEWEWHQVHWWWTYIAKDIDTWRYYAEMRDYLYSYDPEKFKKLWREEKSIIDNLIKDLADNWGKLEEYIEWAIKWYEAQMEHENNWYFKNDIQKKIDFLKSLDLKDFTFEGGERHLYEVEYPDPVKADTPTWSNYLEENKVLSRNELDKIIKALEKKKTQWSERAMNNLEDDIEIWKEITGEDLVHTLSMSMSPRWASKFLESIGYDGIHYFWVRDWEWNVIFNEDNIKIINHEKYQKADIDPEATSPEDLIEVNDKWLDVMVKFVSEKQKKNATDVNKELLTDNGNPYMWTSTNKYKSKVITDWRNVEDSKYKEYTDKWIQVAWFTNNSSMSYSYADYKSKLAPVKKFKSIDELNKFFKENPNNYERILWNWIDDGVLKSSVVYEMKENDGRFELISNSTETLTQSMKDFYDGINNDWFWGNIWEMPENKDEALKKLQEYYNEHDYEIDWERTVKLLKNWNVERTVVKEPTVYKRFDTKLDALAEWYTIAQEADLYHYQWVIQKMKNPLVVDIRSKDNTPSTWSRLWTVNDIFNKEWINYNKEVDYYIRDVEEAMDGFSERMKALEQYWNDAYRDDPYGEVSQFMWNVQLSANNWVAYMVDELEDLLNDPAMWEDLKIGLDTEVYGDLRDYGRTLRDVITELRNFINTDRNYYALKKLSPEWIESWVKDMGAPKEIVKMIKNKNWKDMLGNWRDIGDKWWRENIRELLTTNWMDLETNDWVRYALDSGKYDWVIFKNIIDYGWLPKEWWENAKGGDVAVTFRSNQFKTWDNEDPTDSKYIRYQRVYHWSPADFDRFDSSHMWEWEWAQAHGWWHYVAVEENTWRHYAEMRGNWQWSYKWKNRQAIRDMVWLETPEEKQALRTMARMEEWGWSFDKAKKDQIKDYNEYIDKLNERIDRVKKWDHSIYDTVEEAQDELEKAKNELKILESLSESDFKKTMRNLYEVEIPDIKKADTPTWSNYLEEGVRNTDPDFREKFIKPEQVDKFVDLLKNYDEVAWQKLADKMYHRSPVAPTMLWADMYKELSRVLGSEKEASKFLNKIWYDGIRYFWWRDGEAYVIFNDDALEIKNHEKYQKVEYEYDENWNRKWIKFWEDNEFDPSIFWENTKEEQIEEDKEKEKSNPFYNAWIKYNDQNYKDDQLTFNEFIQWINEWWDKQQRQYDEKMKELLEAENDPKMLELQLRAVKLLEEEWNVGKKFWKNVSKEVRDRQQAEVEKKREQLAQDIFDWMYPWLKFEDATYKDQESAWDKEAEWEMLGKDKIEEKLKYFRKDNNGDWIAKDIKIESPQEKRDKIEKSWNFSEIFSPVDRVLEWKTPQWQKWILDKAKDPKQFKKVMEKINKGTTKTKVTLKDITQEVRALEKTKAQEEAEKERQKKERQEAMAKKKQDEYKRNVRMKAFQRLVDMQRFEKYPFLTEDEIKKRWWFTDEEWKKITEQEDLKFPPKKYGEKAIKDFNKAVDEEVRFIIEWLSWQNTMKRKDAEKNLWEIEDIDLDILLGRDEEKWQKEVDEFKRLAEEKWEDNTKKRLKEAKDNIMDVEIDKERENSKSEKERVDKIIKSTKSDKTVWWSIKEFSSDIITPVSTRIREISPKIYREVMRYFQNKDIKTNQRLKEIDPFLKAMKKIRKENPVRFMDIWVNLANRNIWYANGLLKEYWVTVPTELLDQIYLEADDVGLNINYLWSYYPLSVKAPRKFLEELMKVNKKDIASEIEKKIMEESQKKWWPLEESEITAIINEVIVWWEQGADINIWNAHLKKRNTEIKWTPKMLEYCDDPISTLISYIEWMTQSIERAKFLWKSRSWNVHTLADYVYNEKNGLDPDQQDELMDLLKAVFNDANPSKAIQTWRDIATLTTLWSPSSTLTQLWDLSFSVYENGWKETLKAVWDVFASRKAFDLKDMWVLNRWEEYTNINSQKNLLQKAIHNVFKLTLFSRFDTLWKSTFIQSTWNKRKKRALKWENGDPQLRRDIMKITDDEYMTDKIINDLKNWVFSEDVALVMYMKLWDIQPLTRAQMPKAYLNNPNGRLFYQFKTFGIKQLDYVLQETKKQTKNFKNLSTTDKLLRVVQIANMVFIMTLLGVWADELKDITMRRRSNSLILRWLMWEKIWSEQIWEKMEDNVLKLFGLSRYTIMQMKNDPVDAITSLFTTLPATNIINYPFKDIYKAFKDDGSINWRNPSAYQLIPVIWKYRYWIYWGGQDKQQQALDKEKKTTTSGWSSRSTRTTKSRSTRNTRNSR